MATKNDPKDKNLAASFEDASKLVFKETYAAAEAISVRAGNGKLYPTTKDKILKRAISGTLKIRDYRFFTLESIQAAQKKK